MARIVEAEATGEGFIGKQLVARVVLNRVEHESFPDTIEGVVFAELPSGYYEFSPIHDGRYFSIEVTDETISAVKSVLKGEIETVSLFFQSARLEDNWMDNNRTFVGQVGGHNFYK